MYAYTGAMKRTCFFLPEPLLKRMREYAEKHDLTIVDIVRRAIVKWLDDEDAKDKK
jgi:hypothetical protein